MRCKFMDSTSLNLKNRYVFFNIRNDVHGFFFHFKTGPKTVATTPLCPTNPFR